MPLPNAEKKFSYEDYLKWPEEERWEIIDGVPELIIEIISASSIKMDRVIKFNKYEKAGVKEYWIVEPDQKLVSVFLLQENMRFSRPEMYSDDDKIKVFLLPALLIDLSNVFESDLL